MQNKNRLLKPVVGYEDSYKISDYGVGPTTVSDIKRGKIWKHVSI